MTRNTDPGARDEFRYGHKLWAELKTGLLLKARMLNESRKVIEQFHYPGTDQRALDTGVGAAELRPPPGSPAGALRLRRPRTPGGR
jgi:hypothetical protein